jgi:hypothetical protein
MAIFQNNLLAGAGAQSSDSTYAIDQSIRFNPADSAYMEKTFSGAGNKKTFTISLWLKRSLLGSRQDIWSYNQDVPLTFMDEFSETHQLGIILFLPLILLIQFLLKGLECMLMDKEKQVLVQRFILH